MGNTTTCNGYNIIVKPAVSRMIKYGSSQGYLTKMAEVIALICRFKPVNFSATGLSAASASSAHFSKVDFSVS